MYRQQRAPRPPVGGGGSLSGITKRLIIINCGVYLVQLLVPRITAAFGLIPPAVFELQVWRLFTYMFLHGGLFHLGLNMLVLYMFGTHLERTWGRAGFLRYYLLCGVGAGLFTLIPLESFFYANHIGASGAIYGLLLAFGMLFPETRLLVLFVIPMQARHVVLVLGFIALASSLSATQDGVSHIAHLGGLVAGFFLLRRQGQIPPGAFGRTIQRLQHDFHRWRMRKRMERRQRDHWGGPRQGGRLH